MQQPPQMIPMVPSFPPTNITTEQIQKYLDENKRLILAIMENQNLGKLTECAQYQALLQKNLMYLAAIADAQPQASTVAPQMAPHPAMQPPGYFMPQHPQAAAAMMQQQQQQQQPGGIFPPRAPFQFGNTQPQDPHQQAMLAQTGLRPMGVGHGMHMEAGLGSSSVGTAVQGGNKPDGSDAGTAGSDGKEGK